MNNQDSLVYLILKNCMKSMNDTQNESIFIIQPLRKTKILLII